MTLGLSGARIEDFGKKCPREEGIFVGSIASISPE
jgi:hypothetical protein